MESESDFGCGAGEETAPNNDTVQKMLENMTTRSPILRENSKPLFSSFADVGRK